MSHGAKAAAELAELSVRVPGRAAAAMLQGVYQLPPEKVASAKRSASIVAWVLVVSSAMLVTLAIGLGLLA